MITLAKRGVTKSACYKIREEGKGFPVTFETRTKLQLKTKTRAAMHVKEGKGKIKEGNHKGLTTLQCSTTTRASGKREVRKKQLPFDWRMLILSFAS